MDTNGHNGSRQPNGNGIKPLSRAQEAEDLLTAVQQLVTTFIQAADNNTKSQSQEADLKNSNGDTPGSTLVDQHHPQELQNLLNCHLPEQGLGRSGFLTMVQQIYRHSVNIWDQGFLDKLYATTTPVGLAADLVLSSLNTNVHVYQVSPALTIIEKTTARALANMFGLRGVNAGGVSQPGGSAANQSSMVIARNVLFPETKVEGNGGRKFVLFTSVHGHYSVEKAAQMFGFGSKAVRGVEVDEQGRMKVDDLERQILRAKEAGETPFYINATAGTTVLGSFDPFAEVAEVARRYGLWLHVDGSWGGSVVFSEKQKELGKLRGVEKADSISICPHKMLNVPLTCSFLLGKDLREFQKGMTLPAGYLFHNADDVENGREGKEYPGGVEVNGETRQEFWDLADLTPQCGRRGDALKLALSWIYYGTSGYRDYIDHGFSIASHLANLVAGHSDFTLVSENPPPCLQICFYYKKKAEKNVNSRITERVVGRLIERGFMTDYAPGEEGKFFRVVVNGQTKEETVEGLVRAIESVGMELGL